MVQLELYIREPINFLRTLTLKNSHFADLIWKNDVQPEYQDRLPTELNPYYRHARGEYILANDTTDVYGVQVPNRRIYRRFDEMIYIQSLDTQQQVPFTKETLAKHPKTAALYRIPNSYYTKLCESYPQYSDLIKSIVYPIKKEVWCPKHQRMETFETADNYTIFGYDEGMFQENERTSIYTAINTTLEMIRVRWDVKEFNYEDMFPIVHQGILWHLLYLTIFGQRILNIRTSKVHEFHIWNYLNSKGVGDYRDVLTLNQSLFLYRNINYLLRNKGTQKNFSILIGALLKPMNVSLYSKSIVQNVAQSTSSLVTSDLTRTTGNNSKQKTLVLNQSNLSDSFANTCKPKPKILSNVAGDDAIIEQAECLVNNTRYRGYGKAIDVVQKILNEYKMGDGYTRVEEMNTGTIETTELTYDKEQQSHLEYQDEDLFDVSTNRQNRRFTVTPHTFLDTKAHEINRNVVSTLYNQVYAKFVQESILYRASESDLKFSVIVTPPDTKIPLALDGNQVVALLMYCACREVGITLEQPPDTAEVMWPYKKEFPEIPEIFYYQGHKRYSKAYLTDYGFTDMVPYPLPLISADDMSEKIHSQAVNFLHNFIEVHRSASSIHMEILSKVYQQRCVKGWIKLNLVDNLTYKQFFNVVDGLSDVIIQYDRSSTPELKYSQFFDALMKQFYPVDTTLLLESETALNEKYRRVKQFFVEMCSYNVTFFDHIEGMTNVSHTFWHNTFDVQRNFLVGRFEYMWHEFCMKWMIHHVFRVPTELLFRMDVHGPYEYIYRYVWELCDFTDIKLEHVLKIYFTLCEKDLDVTGKLQPRWKRRDNTITDTIRVDLGDDPSMYEHYDLAVEEQSHYMACRQEDHTDGTRTKIYTPYPHHNQNDGVINTHLVMDIDMWSPGGSVTPVFRDDNVVEVIEEKTHKWNEIPDYILKEESSTSTSFTVELHETYPKRTSVDDDKIYKFICDPIGPYEFDGTIHFEGTADDDLCIQIGDEIVYDGTGWVTKIDRSFSFKAGDVIQVWIVETHYHHSGGSGPINYEWTGTITIVPNEKRTTFEKINHNYVGV